MSKLNINIKYSHDNLYKVSITDNYGSRVVVYEQNDKPALVYALSSWRESDSRHKAE